MFLLLPSCPVCFMARLDLTSPYRRRLCVPPHGPPCALIFPCLIPWVSRCNSGDLYVFPASYPGCMSSYAGACRGCPSLDARCMPWSCITGRYTASSTGLQPWSCVTERHTASSTGLQPWSCITGRYTTFIHRVKVSSSVELVIVSRMGPHDYHCNNRSMLDAVFSCPLKGCKRGYCILHSIPAGFARLNVSVPDCTFIPLLCITTAGLAGFTVSISDSTSIPWLYVSHIP